jgi:hypothetical protein
LLGCHFLLLWKKSSQALLLQLMLASKHQLVCSAQTKWTGKRSAGAATLDGVLVVKLQPILLLQSKTSLSSFFGLFFGSKPVLCWLVACCWFLWGCGDVQQLVAHSDA